MAVTIETNQMYCTTADIHFGPIFRDANAAEEFCNWCYRNYGDPRRFPHKMLLVMKREWELDRQVQAVIAQARKAADDVGTARIPNSAIRDLMMARSLHDIERTVEKKESDK